ncbi:MAG TPA: hypothetical protein DCR20_12425 [Planctomycetaceae bacterium]|nr:hypothetical protein [Planctomycetaceae bacterium]
MQAKTAGFPIVVVIGQQSPVFSGLRQWLKDALPRGPAGNFRTIAEALESSLLAAQPPDLTIVLREYSDQYAPQDVSRLIGRVLFSRLLCCSTAWCVSDGRTHDVWPIACRTELQTAEARIMHELQGFLQQQSPVSPIAAAEEVFTVHATAAEYSAMAVRKGQSRAVRAFVMSSDLALRSTLQAVLQTAGVQAESGNHDVLAALLTQTPAAPPELLFVDLDDAEQPDGLAARVAKGGLRVVAVTGFTGCRKPDWAEALLDKSEFALQATNLLRRWVA